MKWRTDCSRFRSALTKNTVSEASGVPPKDGLSRLMTMTPIYFPGGILTCSCEASFFCRRCITNKGSREREKSLEDFQGRTDHQKNADWQNMSLIIENRVRTVSNYHLKLIQVCFHALTPLHHLNHTNLSGQ